MNEAFPQNDLVSHSKVVDREKYHRDNQELPEDKVDGIKVESGGMILASWPALPPPQRFAEGLKRKMKRLDDEKSIQTSQETDQNENDFQETTDDIKYEASIVGVVMDIITGKSEYAN